MPLTNNQLLKYNGSQWTNSVANIVELGDVSISSPSSNQVLSYNGSTWINQQVPSRIVGSFTPVIAATYPLTTAKAGNAWYVAAAGTIGATAVTQNDIVLALVDNPGNTTTNWTIIQKSQGYIPENISNKESSSLTPSSSTNYPSSLAVANYVSSMKSSGVSVVSTSNISVTGTGTLTTTANGVFVVDGYTLQLNDSILLAGQTTASQNGVYTVTVLGTVSSPTTLQRRSDYSAASNFSFGNVITVVHGTVYTGYLFYQSSVVTTLETSSINYSPITVSGGSLLISNNLSELTATASTARSNISAASSGANTDITSVLLSNGGLKQKGLSNSNTMSIVNNNTYTANRNLLITTTDADTSLTIGATTSISGTNTGDETSSSIQTKVGIASGSNTGLLSSSDWTVFNNKVSTTRTVNGHALSSDVSVVLSDIVGTVQSVSTTGNITAWSSLVTVNATSGAVTVTLPAVSSSTLNQYIAVVKSDSSGNSVIVQAHSGTTLNGSATLTNQYNAVIITNDGGTNNWVVASSSSGGTSLLSALTDVTITSPSNNQVLTYNSSLSKWVNSAPSNVTSATITDLLTDNDVINCPCDEFGYPDFISLSNNTVVVQPVKVKAQTQVFTTPSTTLNLNTLFGNNSKPAYWIYADYNSGSPIVSATRVAPSTYYSRTFATGSYLNFENMLADPFGLIWIPSAGTNSTYSTLIKKFGTQSIQVPSTNEVSSKYPSITQGGRDTSYTLHMIRDFQTWMIDLWVYPVNGAGSVVGTHRGSFFGFDMVLSGTTVLMYISTNGTTFNITAGSTLNGTITLSSWNYLGFYFDGFQYVANVNGTTTTFTTSASISYTSGASIGFGGSSSTSANNYDEIVLTPFVRPWNNAAVSALDTTTVSTYGSPFASYLATTLTDGYGQQWYLNTQSQTLTAGLVNNTITAISLSASQFLVCPSFPRLSLLDEWTVEAWVRSSGVSNALIDTGSITTFGLNININNTSINFSIGTGASYDIFNGVFVAGSFVNTWAHVVVTYSSVSGYATYVNGVAGPTSSTTTPIGSSSICYVNRLPASNTSGPAMQIAELRVTPWRVYTGAYTTPTVPLGINASRDLLDTTTNTMVTQGLNPGTPKRVYLGMIKNHSIVNYYAKKQNISPAVTLSSGSVMRDGTVLNNRKTLTLPRDIDQPYFNAFPFRKDGQLFVHWGQYGSPTGVFGPPMVAMTYYPISPFTTLPKLVSVAFSRGSVLGVDAYGNVWGCGANNVGELGIGVSTALPSQITYRGVSPTVYAITNSQLNSNSFNCSFILDQGNLYATGSNDVGQLGLGNTTNPNAWTVVPKISGNNWGGVRSNGRCTWAWTDNASGNLLYATGFNTSGQLGIGTTSSVTSLTACKFSNGTAVGNVKTVVETIITTTAVFNAYILLNNGDLYITGRGQCVGSPSGASSFATACYGPIASNVDDIFITGSETTNNSSVAILKGGDLYIAGTIGPFKSYNSNDYVSTFAPARQLGNVPMKNVSSVRGVLYTDTPSFGAITYDGKLYVGGLLNSISNALNGNNTQNGTFIYQAIEMVLNPPVSDCKLFYSYDSSTRYAGMWIYLANGELYSCGSQTYNDATAAQITLSKYNYPIC